MNWDVFICHAHEDKPVVRELAGRLRQEGARVWYDEFTLALGDSLRRSIDRGLSDSRYGVVVLSRAFFGKGWRQYELDGLTEREARGVKVILPVWHQVSSEHVARYSPALAGKLAARTEDGWDRVTSAIMAVLRQTHHEELQPGSTPQALPDIIRSQPPDTPVTQIATGNLNIQVVGNRNTVSSSTPRPTNADQSSATKSDDE